MDFEEQDGMQMETGAEDLAPDLEIAGAETDEETAGSDAAAESAVEAPAGEDTPLPEEHPTSDAQWAEARRRNALEVRRQADALARQQLAARDAEIARLCEGRVHPVTKQPIRTFDEYADALKAQEMMNRGMDPALVAGEVNRQVQSHPAILAAQAMSEGMRRQQAGQAADDQLRQISRINPAVKSFEDLEKMDGAAEMRRLVAGGADLVSAYKAASYDAMLRQKAAAGKQAAMNAMNGKQHLAPAPGAAAASDGLVEVPPSVMAMMQEVFPDDTPAQIKVRYNDTL